SGGKPPSCQEYRDQDDGQNNGRHQDRPNLRQVDAKQADRQTDQTGDIVEWATARDQEPEAEHERIQPGHGRPTRDVRQPHRSEHQIPAGQYHLQLVPTEGPALDDGGNGRLKPPRAMYLEDAEQGTDGMESPQPDHQPEERSRSELQPGHPEY